MKNIKFLSIIFGGLIILLTYTRCNKFLDQEPISSVTPGNFWKDKNDAETWMAGVYNSVQSTLRSNWFDWGEVRSDNVRGAGTGNAQTKMLNNLLSANDSDINGVTNWTDLYTTISLCNYGIKYYPQMIEENLDQGATIYTDYLGQSYGLRALMYFYGLRVWGRIPINNEPIESLSQETQFPRSDLETVKKQILDDIEESLKYIGSNTGNKFYIQKAAIYALKTDVHMWFKEYDEALIASQNCITESKCSWVNSADDWKNIFLNPTASTETIFNLYWESTERGNAIGVCQKLGSSSNTNQYMITPAIFQQLKERIDPLTELPADGRFWTTFDTISYKDVTLYSEAAGGAKYGKFSRWDPNAKRTDNQEGGEFVYEGNSDCSVKIPIYRFADVMLLRAEALAHKGRFQEALDIVNKVRSRVGYTVEAKMTDYTGDILSGIERTILTERQYELLGEGKRWFDLCRIGNTYDFTNNGYEYLREIMNPILTARQGAVPFDNNTSTVNGMGRILYPINSNAFNANPKLIGDQNPPYDE